MNSSQLARMLVRLIAVVLVVLSVVRAADFMLSLVFSGGHFSFSGFVSGLLRAAIPVGVAALVMAVGETIATFLDKGNER